MNKYTNAPSFEHEGRRYLDCWIETTARHPGGKNMDGLYVAGHYPNYEAATKARDAILAKHPKAVVLITMLPDVEWNRSPHNPMPGW
jgi:hypothetical protein